MIDPEATSQLGAELEQALLRALASEWRQLNYSFFRDRLRPPVLQLSDATTRLGRFDPSSRTLELNRRLVLEQPWGTVVEVLKHELAHQFVFEALGVHDEATHGPHFQKICHQIGADPRAAGMPSSESGSSARATGEGARVLERIARLMALAESANLHEAEAAMRAAQRLMLKHNLAQAELPTGRDYGYRHLGRPTGRVTEAERVVSAILSKHFFVESIWVSVYRPLEGKRGSVLEIAGAEDNLDMASYVHSFLHHAAERLWEEHRQARGIRGNRDRRTYLAGVMTGFLAKLDEERRAQKTEGLVWVGDPQLASYYRKRHPRVVSVRYAGQTRNEAHAEGREAGRRLVLAKPVGSGPSGGGPKLLGR